MFYLLFISIAFSSDHYIYFSNDGKDENDGTYESPLSASSFSKIGDIIKNLSPEETDHIHLVFKEGIYFSENWALKPWEFNHEKINKITIEGEPNKKAVIQGSKMIKNWEKSAKYENLWKTSYSEPIEQIFVGDKRATLCRLPKSFKRARFYGYETQEDPANSSYLLRILYVQTDCIEMLKKMTPEELSIAEVVVTYWWYTDIMKIIRFDEEKKYIVTRILKTEEHENEKISETSYFFIQGAFPAITEPGEYYQHPDGTLYYYPRPDEDMNTINVYIPITQHAFNFYALNNLMIQNLYFKYMNDVITGAEFNNLCIINCEFTHIKTAVTVYGAHNSQIDHCFIEDTGATALSFSGKNFTVQNCIIRHVGVIPPFLFAIDFWNDVNNTYILNNDISDGRSTLIHFGSGYEYEVQILQSVLIENNHLHHSGYGIFDDLAALFFGKHPRGTIINHNKIHDFYANNYCGNGIYPDHGSSGNIVTNNIVYNVSHSTFNLHWGKENEVANNIMAYAKTGFSFGYYHSDSYTLKIHHNIVYLERDDAYPAEGPLLNDDVTNIFDNNIYYKTNDRSITIAGLSFNEWQEKGFDKNSLVIDPLFNDPKNGDFTFKSKENINKIGFTEFNYTFGVIGDEWRARAANYEYHDPLIRTDEYPLVGIESFENGYESYFIKRFNMNRNPDGIIVEITTENAFSGSHSLKIQHISENTGYWFGFKTLFKNGTFEFSLMMFLNEESSYSVDFVVDWIIVKNGRITSGWDGGPVYDCYPFNKWFKFGLKLNVSESILNDKQRTFTMIVGKNETTFNLNRNDLSSVDFISMTSSGKGASYIDDVKAETDQYIEPYFSDCFREISNDEPNAGTITESISESTNEPEKEPNSNNKKSGLGVGPIIGIVVAVIVVIAIVIVIVVVVRLKKTRNDSSTIETFL